MDIRPEVMAAFDASADLEARVLGIIGKAIGEPQGDIKNTSDDVIARQFCPLPVVTITCAANIKPEPIKWLWGWMACPRQITRFRRIRRNG